MVLRDAFPVFERLAYLNAGTNGPLPTAAVEAARAESALALREGRARARYERRTEIADALRSRYAALLGADASEVALTTCTTEGVARVLLALDLQPGDEIVTSDQEHPGVYGPLAAARARGVNVRAVPFDALADAVSPSTRLVACSHVSWMTGEIAPAALAHTGVPVLYDAAQSVGAIEVDVRALNAAFYAGSGQKWLCGPEGTGMLYIAPEWRERVAPLTPGYVNLADAMAGLDAVPHPDARAFDVPALANEPLAAALASLEVLDGGDRAAGRALAARAADALRERGRVIAPRGDTTLVSFESDDPEAEASGLVEAGVVVRYLPGTPYVRASFGAWNDDSDLERLLAALRYS
jgi:selenocysteine lyase/cysteine desulfurase